MTASVARQGRNAASGVIFTAVILAVAAGSISAQQRGLSPEDYYDLVTVSDVAVSPLGDLVAFTVTSVQEAENRRHREVWMQVLENGRPDGAPYRFTDPTEDSHSPRWAPDGSVLAFTSRRGEDPNTSWFVRVGGPGGEAFHIDGVRGAPSWSGDGRWIGYIFKEDREDQDAVQDREGWVAPDAVSRTLNAERFDGRVVTSIRYKEDGELTLQAHFSVTPKAQLYVVSSSGGRPRQLTDGGFNVRDVAWASDAGLIYFTGDEGEDDEQDREVRSDLWVARLTDGSVTKVTATDGASSSPAVSPDGARITFLFAGGRGEPKDLFVVNVAADGSFLGVPLNLTSQWDLEPMSPQWSADGTGVLFLARIGGSEHLFRVPAAGGTVTQITQGPRTLRSVSFSDRGHVMAYTSSDAVSPTELYIARGDGTSERRATGFNDDWLDDVTLMAPERLTWTVGDGTEIEGWVIKPVGYTPGNSYPLILKIHGGPHSAYGHTFSPTFHVLSAAGFFVLYSNPRGSAGYGQDFQYATRGQWGVLDSEDYIGGVDAALRKYPDADRGRVGVSGGSYGGFMTNWLTATTDRFYAAVTSRSIANWESWWGSSDSQGLTEYEFFGPPWERRDLYRRLSPISYVENVTAPTLIINSENDYRTPIGEGEQWFMALKGLGVPVEMVRYPRSSHGLSRTGEPWLLVDRLERIRSWFVHWLINDPPSVSAGG
ncbi:MAG: prolyl oligopeptidase family serine peptidase [Longimicrobiales bacterium]